MPFDIKSNLDISEDEIATDDPHGDALHHFSDSDDNENLLSQSYNSTHFSTTEDKFIKDHDLKVRAFEALQSPMQRSASMSLTKSAPKRRQLVIEFPKHPVPYHPTPSEASHNNNHTQDPKANANALPEEYPSHELVELFQNVKMCLDLRHKYLDRSLQKDEAVNPKNKPDWTIYPPPPKPTYKLKNRFNQIPGEVEDEEVFDFEKCHIPDQIGRAHV